MTIQELLDVIKESDIQPFLCFQNTGHYTLIKQGKNGSNEFIQIALNSVSPVGIDYENTQRRLEVDERTRTSTDKYKTSHIEKLFINCQRKTIGKVRKILDNKLTQLRGY